MVNSVSNCLSFVDPLHVKYLGGDLVLEVALDHCSSWYRYVQQNFFICLVNCRCNAPNIKYFLDTSVWPTVIHFCLYVRSDLGDYPAFLLYNWDHWSLNLSHRYQWEGQRRSVRSVIHATTYLMNIRRTNIRIKLMDGI